MLCFLDGTGEALPGLLGTGRAGSNTTAGHIESSTGCWLRSAARVAIGIDVLIRSDSAGAMKGFLADIGGLRAHWRASLAPSPR
jgi:hypothetical protein